MTFLTKLDDKTLGSGAVTTVSLSQRGRSGLELLGSMQKYSSGTLRPIAAENFAASAEGAELAARHAERDPSSSDKARIKAARAICEADNIYRLERFVQRYVAEENFNRGVPAMEERRAEFEAFTRSQKTAEAGGSLDLSGKVDPPKYYAGVEWHLEPGGWDGYDLYGALFAFGVGPYVFRHGGYAAVGIGEDITDQRVRTIQQFPKSSYERIYEPGCGGVSTLKAVNTVFPRAELHGSDLSPLLLRNGYNLAARFGLPVHLKLADAVENSGEPDESYDGVITYALHHELPPKANRKLFAEMFRIMKPGADIVISDPPPFRAVPLFHAVILDWDTDNREEPFFSAVLHESLDEMLAEAGFTNVESYGIGRDHYPWITRATKPATVAEAAQ